MRAREPMVVPPGQRVGPQGRRPAAGFTYLVLLGLLALAGAGLAATGTHWQAQAQRAREAELLFRGLQIREALNRFARATPPGQAPRPPQLEDLLEDARHQPPQHHLRQLWTDPFTGQADWVLLRDAAGGILGVHSRASQLAFQRHRLPAGVANTSAGPVPVSAWQFIADALPDPNKPGEPATSADEAPPPAPAAPPRRAPRSTPRET